MDHQPERIVLVTGGSRGLGARVARQLGSVDTHVVVTRDISDEVESAEVIDGIASRFGRLDTLILNSSDALDTGADPECAMRLNRDAQRRLALAALPLMPVGGRIVFVTSHQAHFFPDKAVPKGYTAVAASMRAGETALLTRRSEFRQAGVQLTVVSGDMSHMTFADAVVDAATTPNPASIVFVGRTDYLMTA
ncbi:short chain dehydrogenase [Mycolicibacterium flavescens]|uniref:SDR family oxidoreductase n=1 Tax=Mycobacterium TaxID=1763 RepID=UPI0008016611|nr:MULTISPECIES: SDR family oxidoreductase [Mycobacterium]OBF98358.1 short-chain dehydrogenase [Mycobacterium sp. 852002-51152_SCH6134967]VEG38902.1 short chain dehydrogenase [Mycolicibacterium flavescens]